MTEIIITFLLLLLIVLIIFSIYLIRKNNSSNSDNNFKDITNDLFQRMDSLNTKLEVEQVKLSENLIGSTNSVKEMIKFSEQSQNRTAKEMLNATQKVTNILQDNSKRGAWGEKAADDLLKSMGLIEGKSYQKQQTLPWKSEDESLLKPDFVFNIDGQDKLFIMDVKFPLSHYYKMYDEDGNQVFDVDNQKKLYLSEFRKRIVEVSKYVNTSENTIDLAAMFIPVTGILDETLKMDSEIVDYAMKYKVVLVSPASFYALINFLKYSETIFKVSKEQKEIIKIFGSLKEQWSKYEASFEKVENKLSQLSKEIDTVKNTRTKAMSRELNKVDNILNSNFIEESD
jgi:DNA anti-recombination protein RmuC